MPVHWLFRPISIAVATWSRVEDGFDNTAETSSHFVDALSRSPVHPVDMKANSRAMILIRLFPVNELAMDFPSSRVDHGYLKVMIVAQAVVAEMLRKLFAVRDSLKIALEDPDPISKRDVIFHIKKEFWHCRYLKSISAIGDHARVTITGKGLPRLRALPRMSAIDRFNETAMLARGRAVID
jgi:hypothetical protein